MKKRFALALAVVMALTALTGCGGTSSSAAPAASDTVKIGINYELSGGVASYGQQSVEGIEFAIEQLNAAGGVNGKKIELVKYDNKSEPAEATMLANKLIDQDKVLAILGPATSGAFKAQIPVANKGKVPVASGSATADDVTVSKDGTVQEYAFRICFSDSFQGVTMANFAKEKLSASRAVIYMDSSSDYAKGLAENFERTFVANGGTIVAKEAYVAKDTDFNAVITKLKGLDFDVLFIPGYYEEVGLIIKQARAQGLDHPVLGADGFDAPELVDMAGASALNDVYFSNHYSSLDKDPVVLQFINDFKAKTGSEPSAFNALGYDLAMFAADAIGRATELTPEAVKNAMASTENFVGVTGTVSVDENHNAVKSIVVIELQNGVQVSSVKI